MERRRARGRLLFLFLCLTFSTLFVQSSVLVDPYRHLSLSLSCSMCVCLLTYLFLFFSSFVWGAVDKSKESKALSSLSAGAMDVRWPLIFRPAFLSGPSTCHSNTFCWFCQYFQSRCSFRFSSQQRERERERERQRERWAKRMEDGDGRVQNAPKKRKRKRKRNDGQDDDETKTTMTKKESASKVERNGLKKSRD